MGSTSRWTSTYRWHWHRWLASSLCCSLWCMSIHIFVVYR